MIEPTTIHGTLPFITEGPVKKYGRRGELDSVTWKILVAAPTATDDATALGFARDSQIADAGFSIWVDNIDETPESDLITELSIHASGLITEGERRRRTISAGQREVAVGPNELINLAWVDAEKGKNPRTGLAIRVLRRVPSVDEDTGEVEYEDITTPSGLWDRWNIKEAILTVRDVYFVTTRPDTTVIGTAVAPPNAPTPPPYLWGDYESEKRANHPNGWVLEDRNVEELHGDPGGTAGLFQVTDTTSYYYPAIPD
jgi:hypothetical protein